LASTLTCEESLKDKVYKKTPILWKN